MKSGFIAAAVISAALFSWSGPVAQARSAGGGGRGGGGYGGGGHMSGGGHSGGFSGGHVSGGGHGYGGARSVSSGRSGAYRPSSIYSGGGYRGDIRGHGLMGRPGRSNRTGGQGTVTTRSGGTHAGAWARNHPRNSNRFNSQTQQRLRDWNGRASNFAEARQHHNGCRDGHHGRNWWHNRCDAIIIVGGGYWGWYDGWWYPAWGYDSYYSNYDYDGPVYGYDGLAPDEAIALVQSELQRLGYYQGSIDGILGRVTQDALRRYQRDRGLPVTGAIDPETVRALRLA